MKLTIDGQIVQPSITSHGYRSILYDSERLIIPDTPFFVLFMLASRYLQGEPMVHCSELWQNLTARYIYRTKETIHKLNLPLSIGNNRFGSYSLIIPKEMDIQIASSLLEDEDARIRDETKRFLYATVGVASVNS